MPNDPTSAIEMFTWLADPAAWDRVGYERFPIGPPVERADAVTVPTIELGAARSAYGPRLADG